MSASHPHSATEIELSHATWRQGTRYGLWKSAAVVDGVLVAETEEGPTPGDPIQLRMSLQDGRSVSALAETIHLLQEPGQPTLMMVPLDIDEDMLAEMAEALPAPAAAPILAEPAPAARASLPWAVRFSFGLSISALFGALLLTALV